MTGIERLRKLSEDMLILSLWARLASGTEKDWDCYKGDGRTINDELLSIASQIERETEEQSARLYDERVGEETDVCELFGVEPVDDPLTSLRRHVESLTDTVENLRLELGEARDDSAWVREYGGLEAVKASIHQGAMEHGCLLKVAETLGTSIYDGAGNADALLDKLEKRLMPEGMEWPTVDGKPVVIGERMRSCGIDDCKVVGIDPANSRLTLASDNIEEGKATYFTDSAEYCHRPTPKVLDADGAEIREKRDVWWICEGDERGVHAERLHVESIGDDGLVTCSRSPFNSGTWVELKPSELYVHKPALAADGKPLREGETVYVIVDCPYSADILAGDAVTPVRVYGEDEVNVEDGKGHEWFVGAGQLTHERPDSWERIEEDATKNPFDYCKDVGHRLDTCENSESYKARDLVRRAKKLAGVDND